MSWTQLVGVIITFTMIGGFTWFFKASTVGISMRAVSDDQFASMSIGISVPKVFGLAWATAGLSAAAAGGMVSDLLVRELTNLMKRHGPRRPTLAMGLHVLVSRQDPTFELPVRAVGPYVSAWRARELGRAGWKLAREASARRESDTAA